MPRSGRLRPGSETNVRIDQHDHTARRPHPPRRPRARDPHRRRQPDHRQHRGGWTAGTARGRRRGVARRGAGRRRGSGGRSARHLGPREDPRERRLLVRARTREPARFHQQHALGGVGDRPGPGDERHHPLCRSGRGARLSACGQPGLPAGPGLPRRGARRAAPVRGRAHRCPCHPCGLPHRPRRARHAGRRRACARRHGRSPRRVPAAVTRGGFRGRPRAAQPPRLRRWRPGRGRRGIAIGRVGGSGGRARGDRIGLVSLPAR